MNELEYTEFMRISLKDRIKNEIVIDDNTCFDNLICDLVFKRSLHEKILSSGKWCINIIYELDCNNETISSMWDVAIQSNEQSLG